MKSNRLAMVAGCWPKLTATFSLLLFGVVAVAANAAEPQRLPLVVGHRGMLPAAPENTLAGFRACLALRVGFEFDIRRSKDGHLACLHDETVDRTTDGRNRLADLTLNELRRLDAGSRSDVAFRGEKIPLVDEVFALAAEHSTGSTLIAVDLKEVGGGIEQSVVRLAEKHKVLDRLVFIGTTIELAEVRARLRAANPGAHTAHLAAAPEEIGKAIADIHADWIYVRFLPSLDDVIRIHTAGKRIFLVGPLVAGLEAENWGKAADLSVDAILTDYPLELQKQLRSRSR
jgi:glycerophosphoryl diester phosphodiesterase